MWLTKFKLKLAHQILQISLPTETQKYNNNNDNNNKKNTLTSCEQWCIVTNNVSGLLTVTDLLQCN
jgi:hypothetical protein